MMASGNWNIYENASHFIIFKKSDKGSAYKLICYEADKGERSQQVKDLKQLWFGTAVPRWSNSSRTLPQGTGPRHC